MNTLNNYSPLCKLPQELWKIEICSYFSKTDYINFRLCCKDFRELLFLCNHIQILPSISFLLSYDKLAIRASGITITTEDIIHNNDIIESLLKKNKIVIKMLNFQEYNVNSIYYKDSPFAKNTETLLKLSTNLENICGKFRIIFVVSHAHFRMPCLYKTLSL